MIMPRLLCWLKMLVAAGLVSMVLPVAAVTVPGLYNVEVPVEGSSARDLAGGYAEGLRQVMIRVSGSRDVLALDGIEPLLDNAESLLLSYQVRRDDGEFRLEMNFGAVAVNRALASVSAPVWGANRPLTLAWVAVEDRGNRVLVVAPDASEPADVTAEQWRQAMLAAARERGLPVEFPPAGLERDRGLLSDLWGQFTDRIREASGDLSHDALALIRISRSSGQWRAGWIVDGMDMAGSEQTLVSENPEQIARDIVGRWADAYASRYAVSAGEVGEQPRVDMVLEGITSLADYGGVNKALQGLAPVTSVGVSRVRGERLTAEVTFTGELDQLREYIALDPRFVPVTATPDLLQEDDERDAEEAFESLYQVLYYRWQGAPLAPASGD